MTLQIYQGHIVRKRFGQNFLRTNSVISNIVSLINPKKGQALVEIGPGLAALTQPIASYLDRLFVIEVDQDLVNRLKTNILISHKLTIYQQSAMTVNFKYLSEIANQPLRIFGNIPYNISTVLIFHLLKYIHSIIDIHFMLQKEIVDRLIATPNNKSYGRLSVMTQCCCHIIPVLEVSSSAFFPKPKVHSVMVRITPNSKIVHPVDNLNVLRFVTTVSFNQRRKKISNSLKMLLHSHELIDIGIDPEMRADAISVFQYCLIANYIAKKYNNMICK